MRQTHVQVRIDQMQMLRPRQEVMLIAVNPTGEFFLDSFLAERKLHVDFFRELVEVYEEPLDTALRLLNDHDFIYEKLEELCILYPPCSSVERIVVYVAKGVHLRTNRAILLCDLTLLLKYMELGVFRTDEGKQALLRYLR